MGGLETSEKISFMESSDIVAGKKAIDIVNGLQKFGFFRAL